MVILSNYARSERSIGNSFLDSLSNIKRPYIVRQPSDSLIVTAAKRPLHIVFLPIRVLVEHRGQIGHLIVPHLLLRGGSLRVIIQLLLVHGRACTVLIRARITVLIGRRLIMLYRTSVALLIGIFCTSRRHAFLHRVAQLHQFGRAANQRIRVVLQLHLIVCFVFFLSNL